MTRLTGRPSHTTWTKREKLIDGFVGGAGEAKQSRATTLFCRATFSVLNAQRDEVMNGIERFSRKEKGTVEEIARRLGRCSNCRMRQTAIATEVDGDGRKAKSAWETRIFEGGEEVAFLCERKSTVP